MHSKVNYPTELESNVLNTLLKFENLKTYLNFKKECMSSLAPLLPKNFEIFNQINLSD